MTSPSSNTNNSPWINKKVILYTVFIAVLTTAWFTFIVTQLHEKEKEYLTDITHQQEIQFRAILL